MAIVEPTTRSRTLLFLSIRDSRTPSRYNRSNFVIYDADDEDHPESAKLLSNTERAQPGQGSSIAIDIGTPRVLPAWVDISDSIEAILRTTREKISVLDKLHTKHALPGFTDRSAEERDIEKLTTEITKDFRQCQTLIQKISAEPSSTSDPNSHSFPPSKRKPPSAHAVLAAKNVQRGLAAKLQETSALFRKKQKVYMDKLQGHAIKNQDLLIASGAIRLSSFHDQGMSAVELEEDMAASRSQIQQQQQQQQIHGDQTQARTQELSKIAESIASLAELFKDLSSLVIEQGTILDSVEYNIERTSVAMEGAVRELKVAQGYQRSSGRRQCICLLLVLILAAFVFLIFKPKRHRSVSTSSGHTS